MAIHFEDLDEITRSYMLEESNLGGHYQSPRLTEEGLDRWVALFDQAIQRHNDDWLADQIEINGLLKDEESYTRGGILRYRRVPVDAAIQLAEGEFNRYYLRGLCRRAQDNSIPSLLVYRGKQVRQPRAESEALIGKLVPVDILLPDLRANNFVDAAFGLPGGPNSGITARLPTP